MNPFAESNREIRSERWVSLELEKIVLDWAAVKSGIHLACRSGHRTMGQWFGTMTSKARELSPTLRP